MLLDAPGLFTNIIENGGSLAILAFFVVYFMKAQKEMSAKMDALTAKYEADIKELRNSYDAKVDNLNKQLAELNAKCVAVLSDVHTSNDRLSDAVESLTQKLKVS